MTEEHGQGAKKSPATFRTKFILAAIISVLVGLVLSSAVALRNLKDLGQDATGKIEQGLTDANKEYLENYIGTTAQRIELMLDRSFSELGVVGDMMQSLVDRPADRAALGTALSGIDYFKDDLKYDEKGNWRQNPDSEPAVVSVWGHLLEEDKSIRSDVSTHIRDTAVLDYILPAVQGNGSDKLYMYMVGPRGKSYLRLTPYVDMAREFDKAYPGHNDTDFWDFFFPGIVDGWEKQYAASTNKAELRGQVTLTSPYEDAAGGGIIISAFHPLWDKDNKFAGATAMDFSLSQIVDMVTDVKLAQSGFAFFVQPEGNVLAVNEAGEKVLGLSSKTASGAGVSLLERSLKQSSHPDIKALSLPRDEQVRAVKVDLPDEDGTSHPHILVMERLKKFSAYGGEAVAESWWTLVFAVPEEEIYQALTETRASLESTVKTTLSSQVAVAVVTLFAVFLGVWLVARHMTAGLIALAGAAGKLSGKDYSVRVDVKANDEIGQLGVAFNSMAGEIEQYTQNLENLVDERTRELSDAKARIEDLNKQLRAENLRLGAEMQVAQRLQLMVLPKPKELDEVTNLDIAGYMKPADEVGGDYYDVLHTDELVKIGIGDVTGHGLESGVLMLMVNLMRSMVWMRCVIPFWLIVMKMPSISPAR